MLNSPSYDGSLAMWYIPDIEKINVEQGYIFGDKVIQYLGQFILAVDIILYETLPTSGQAFCISYSGRGRNR